MKRRKPQLVVCLGLLLAAAPACSVSMTTAHISSLKLGADKTASKEASSFAPADTVYAVAELSNVPGKIKVTGRMIVDDVPDQNKGPIPGLEQTLDMDSSGTATFTFSPPAAGWPKGKYNVEVVMLDDTGAQKGQKTASFTVS